MGKQQAKLAMLDIQEAPQVNADQRDAGFRVRGLASRVRLGYKFDSCSPAAAASSYSGITYTFITGSAADRLDI